MGGLTAATDSTADLWLRERAGQLILQDICSWLKMSAQLENRSGGGSRSIRSAIAQPQVMPANCQQLDPKMDAALEGDDGELGTMSTICTQATSLRLAHQLAVLSLKCTCLRRNPDTGR